MAISSKALVELILLGPVGDRRQLQDSPILGDVWMAFAMEPTKQHDLLITPDWHHPAGKVAAKLAKLLRNPPDRSGRAHRAKEAHDVAYLDGLVAARLHFWDVICIVVPMSTWWQRPNFQEKLALVTAEERLHSAICVVLNWVRAQDNPDALHKAAREFARFTAEDRYIALAAIILWAGESKPGQGLQSLADLKKPGPVVRLARQAFELMRRGQGKRTRDGGESEKVYQISLNRKSMPALSKSVAAVKGDAVRNVFKVSCTEIGWAVLDSGIDAMHKAFLGDENKSRVKAAYDFSNIRKLVSLENLDLDQASLKLRLKDLFPHGKPELPADEIKSILQRLAQDTDNDRPINWELVSKLIRLDSKDTPAPVPTNGHGTHVAGILGGRRSADSANSADGMCPDIDLYDFRVLSDTVENTEFSIIAALQFIRYLNNRQSFRPIHGANLSLSIPHDVRNFACGRTPICEECQRVVEDGVVVVAAAGNLGYHSFETKDGVFDGYAAFSITDPGNADDVITVGATHRYWPHTYGVSFFSSRGPTGDGRLKPDLVAPGERIESALPGQEWGPLDGTSMAAPHVSGAAAMLMARYSELRHRPRQVKELLCQSATDLGRERTFQGHGMLDVLRAFQKM